MPKQLTPEQEAKTLASAARIATDAADVILRGVLTDSQIHEYASEQYFELTDLLKRTTQAHLSPDDRESAADSQAHFLIGLAIGRRFGGAR